MPQYYLHETFHYKIRVVSYSAANRLAIIHALDRRKEMSMLYRVIFKSRYYPLEGNRQRMVRANSKKEIRDNWHSIINTDEYRIVKIEEVKEG